MWFGKKSGGWELGEGECGGRVGGGGLLVRLGINKKKFVSW